MSEYLTHPSSHPEWWGQEPEGTSVLGEAYRCLDCAWHGRGGAKATAHHCRPTGISVPPTEHHRIVLTHRDAFGPLPFSCCSAVETAVTQTDMNRGRQRAQAIYDAVACASCGRTDVRLERHHRDGNPLNNAPDNVIVLCTRCHMKEDGRLAIAKQRAREIQPLAVAARRKWAGVSCSVDGCQRPAKYRGLCNSHYYRARNNSGDPGTSPVREYRRTE